LERLLERLQSGGTIVPVFAYELASVRRQVSRARLKGGGLLEQVLQLQRTRPAGARPDARQGESTRPQRGREPPRKGDEDGQHAHPVAGLG
jgi:hypothetical protein